MPSNYNNLKWYSPERESYYKDANFYSRKLKGNLGEQQVKEWFRDHGYDVREATAEEDATKHIDFWVKMNDNWVSVDAKNQRFLSLELRNRWGNPGWLYTGAEYIVHVLEKNAYGIQAGMYMYRRQDMVNYVKRNPGLFGEKCCMHIGNAELWRMGVSRLREMIFITKIA